MRLIDADALQQEFIKASGKRNLLVDTAPTVEPTFGLFKEMLCSECEKRPTENTKTKYQIEVNGVPM